MTTISKLIHDDDFINFLKSDIKFFIDIGASCDSGYSESEILLNYNFSGIMFDCDSGFTSVGSKFHIQSEKLLNQPVKVLSDKVTPDNILEILSENNVKDGFYLSLDIDGYDFFVLDKILSKYKPRFIISEINEKIPPNIKFSVNYDSNYFWDGSHYYGYSISMLESILEKYEYKIKFLDYNNVVLVPGKQEESLTDIYNNGYLNKPDRPTKFYWNNNFEPIYALGKEEQINFIKNFFDNYDSNKSQIDGNKIGKRNFTLE